VTVALAVILFASLLLYCGIKGKSLQRALLGHAETGGKGALLK
jgi:hypothetical protein